jgi:hypothetical protein
MSPAERQLGPMYNDVCVCIQQLLTQCSGQCSGQQHGRVAMYNECSTGLFYRKSTFQQCV